MTVGCRRGSRSAAASCCFDRGGYTAAMAEQTYATHRRYQPVYHFFALPIIAINFLVQIWLIWRAHRLIWLNVWSAVVALALVVLAYVVRVWATSLQDR